MDTLVSSNVPPSKESGYVSEYSRKYYQKNKGHLLLKANQHYADNKGAALQRRRIYRKKRYKGDVAYKLRVLVSRAVSYGMKKDGLSVTKYLPYSFKELKTHLESQFESWMNWENHGQYNTKLWDDHDSSTWTWHIDHIVPQSSLPYFSMKDDNFTKCWALSNLRPLAAKQNHQDGVSRIRHEE